MSQQVMYPGKDGSPQTTTLAVLSESATSVSITEMACYPVIGSEGGNIIVFYDDNGNWERCIYSVKSVASGNGSLTIARSGNGWASSSGSPIEWPAGTKCGRNYTGYDYEATRKNILDHETRIEANETAISQNGAAIESNTLAISETGSNIATVSDSLSAHTENTSNPHAVTPAQIGASLNENLIINGGFDIWQRGVLFNSTSWRPNSDDSYLEDRWLLLSDGNNVVTVERAESTFGTSRYCTKCVVVTATKKFGRLEILSTEDTIPLRGKSLSLSFKARTTPGKVINNIRAAILEWTGTANQVTSDVVASWPAAGSNPILATSWAGLYTSSNLVLSTSNQTFKIENVTVGANANNIGVFVWVDDDDCAIGDELYFGEVKLEIGAIATQFVHQDDTSRCSKHLWGIGGITTQYTTVLSGRINSSGLSGIFHLLFYDKPMFCTPSLLTYGSFGVDGPSWRSGLTFTLLTGANPKSVLINAAFSSAVTALAACVLSTATTTESGVFLEAEI